jgi:diguanylate cyclase (GGDEF)-like protein
MDVRGDAERTMLDLEECGWIRWWHVGKMLSVFFVLWACLFVPAHGQQMSLQEFGQAEGLENLAATSLAQDRGGFVWVGTQNGLYRFDGAAFERFGVREKITSAGSLVVEGERLWFTADGDLWLRQGAQLLRIRPDGIPLSVDAYPQMIAPVPGGVLVVSNWHLLELTRAQGGGWRQREVVDQPPGAEPRKHESVTSVAVGSDGDVWFGCGKSICRRHAGQFESWGEGRGVPQDTWHWLMRSSDGSMWARGVRHVLQLDPGAKSFVDRTDARDGDDPAGTYPLAEDAQHRILSAARGALVRWDGHAWTRFGAAAGMPAGGRLQALMSDREGGVWLGILGAGVARWRGYGQWENWSVESGLPHSVVWRFARAGPPGREVLYAATGAGVASFDPDAGRFVPVSGTLRQETHAIAADLQGNLWVGTMHGRLQEFMGAGVGARRGRSTTLPGGPIVYSIVAQSTGDLWAVSADGLFHRAPNASDTGPLLRSDTGTAADEFFGDLCEDPDGALWLASTAGLARRADGHWSLPLRAASGIAALACLRDGTLAVSSGSDGVHLLTREGTTLRDRDVTPPELRGRVVLSMIEDSRGWLWIATDAGVAVRDRQHRWRLLDQSRGLVWNDTSAGALYEDHDASMWIGTSRGVSHVVALAGLFAPVRGDVVIRSVHRGEIRLSPEQRFRLPWSNDALEVDLALPVYRDRGALALEYRLPGFDDRWTRAAHLDVRLTGLRAGQYRFEVRAIDRELGTPSPVTGFDFEIDPPWWASRAAIGMWIAFATALAYGAYRWRVNSLMRRKRSLEALVFERTRELEESREQLREQATRDALTGLWNRRALTEILTREINRCTREALPLAVVIADIDHFKQVNDIHGHPSGDEVLREYAARLVAVIRPYDTIGRYGGEEFLLVLPGLDITREEHRTRLLAIHAVIAASPMIVGTVTCSFGVAGTDGKGAVDADALVKTADDALYRAKRNGRDRIEWNSYGVPAPSGVTGRAVEP